MLLHGRGGHKDKYKDKDTDKYKVLQRLNVCYIFENVDMTSCDDKYKVKFSGVNIFWGEYFLRINIFQGHLVFRDEYFPRGYIVQGCLFGWGEYFTGVNIFQE